MKDKTIELNYYIQDKYTLEEKQVSWLSFKRFFKKAIKEEIDRGDVISCGSFEGWAEEK